MCLIFDNFDDSLLEDLIKIRYCNNLDKKSPCFLKNNKILHWTDISSMDEVNICKRWFEYILNPNKSGKKFYCYILGLNESFLNDEEFDASDKFNSIYNRFFRSCISYGLKCFFENKEIIIKNIFQEQGQQQNHKYFPWQPINKLEKDEENFIFETSEIQFLGKDHNKDLKSNILQLCDCFLGAVVNLIHGANLSSKRFKQKAILLDMIYPLLKRMMNEPDNKNSEYQHSKRIMIRFFPKEKSEKGNISRFSNQFYTKRRLKYVEDNYNQLGFKFPK